MHYAKTYTHLTDGDAGVLVGLFVDAFNFLQARAGSQLVSGVIATVVGAGVDMVVSSGTGVTHDNLDTIP